MNIIMIIKSRRMKLEENVAGMVEMRDIRAGEDKI
jgi:hypothetical protein